VKRLEIQSPDAKKTAIIDGIELRVISEGRDLPGANDQGISTLAELAWSPDSTAFFITESHGGEVGDWHVSVYVISRGTLRRTSPVGNVMKEFKRHYGCEGPEEPNVGAVKWLDGSKKLLVAAEVPPHSSCPDMGKVGGYVLLVRTGQIVQEFSEKKLRAQWGRYLGRRFARK
jgi:hypothetical protein